MKNKKLIVPLLIVVLLSLFLFPASAEGSIDSLGDFFDYGAGCEITAILDDNSEAYGAYSVIDSNTCEITGLYGNGAYVLSVDVGNYGFGFPLSAGETIVFDCDYLTVSPITDYIEFPSSENCTISVVGYFEGADVTNRYQTLFSSSDVVVSEGSEVGGYWIYDVSYPLSFSYTPEFEFSILRTLNIVIDFPSTDAVEWAPSVDEIPPLVLSADSFQIRFETSKDESPLVGLFGGITSFVSGSVSWMVAFADIVSRNFMLLLFVVLVPACGIGIGLLKRMFATN